MSDIRDVLRDLNIPFREVGEHHHATHGRVSIDCPLCSPGSNRFLCGIGLSFPSASCWRCGRMRVGDALASLSGRRVGEVLSLLAKVVPGASGAIWEPSKPVGVYQPPPGTGELLPGHKKYLKSRRLDPDWCVEHWNIGGIGHDGGRYAWRLFLPIQMNGRNVCWQTRALGKDVEPRYLSSPPEQSSVLLKHTLYGSDFVKHAAIIVEGALDALRVGPGAVSCYGVSFTDAQVVRIAQWPVRFICFDSDSGGRDGAERLCRALEPFPGQTMKVTLTTGKDPGEASDDEIEELRGILK